MTDKKDFIIKDRRVFSKDGVAEKETDKKKEEEKPGKKPEAGAPRETAKDKAIPREDQRMSQLPDINFSTFIMSLNASALVTLGVIDDPANGTKNKNLLLSKQTIDILIMLEEKTRGNLSDEEEQLLKGILYELRILYVKERG